MKNTKSDNLLRQAFHSVSDEYDKANENGKGGIKAVHLRQVMNLIASAREEYWAA